MDQPKSPHGRAHSSLFDREATHEQKFATATPRPLLDSLDEWLNPQPSTIPKAGLGLFYVASTERIVQ